MSIDAPYSDDAAGVALLERENLAQDLRRLADRARRGELACIALRLFKPDGTWQDIVLGGTNDDQRAEALAGLQRRH